MRTRRLPGVPTATGLALLGCLGFAACRDGTAPHAVVADAQARARWNARAPVSYSYELELGCFCRGELLEPVTVTVTDGAVTSRRYTATGVEVATEFATAFQSIEGIFASIATLRQLRLDRLVVRYDRAFGYPVKVVAVDCVDCPDSGSSLVVRNFQPH